MLIKQNTTKLIQVHSLDNQFTLIYEFKTNVVDYDVQIMNVDPEQEENSEPISVYVTRSDNKVEKLLLVTTTASATI